VALDLIVDQPGGFSSLQLPAVDSTHIYADVAGGGPLVAIDHRPGLRSWEYAREPIAPSNLVRHGDGLFFVGSFAVALDAATGTERWTVRPAIDGPLETVGGLGVSAAADDHFYFGTDRWIFALDVATGEERWRLEVGPGWPHPGLVRGIVVSGDTLFVSVHRYHTWNGYTATAHLVAVERRSGTDLWRHVEGDSTDRHIVLLEPRVVGDLLVAADHMKNTYFALDRATGALRWRVPSTTEGFFGPWESPTVGGDTLYGASADRLITAIELVSGRVLWRSQVGSSATAVIPCGRSLLVQDQGSYVLDRRDGRILARNVHRRGGEFSLLRSRFVSFGGRVFVLGDRALYGFRCSS
jgi:outer membrane protein assembly factor BamB